MGWQEKAKENLKKRTPNKTEALAANCAAPVGYDELDINNVRAVIQTGGDMWWDLGGVPKYEIPAGTGKTSLFAGSLWLGGEDASGQLKMAAQRFRQNGSDFWTGPLNTTTAEVDPTSCNKWDSILEPIARKWPILPVGQFLRHVIL